MYFAVFSIFVVVYVTHAACWSSSWFTFAPIYPFFNWDHKIRAV